VHRFGHNFTEPHQIPAGAASSGCPFHRRKDSIMSKRVLIVGVALASGIGVVTAAVASEPAGASTPVCQASQLAPHYDGMEGAAGTFYDNWHFTNVGNTCETIGFVGAENFGSDGRPLATTVTRAGTKEEVVVGHNQKVSWHFSYTDPGVLGCKPEAATNMIVTPPNNTTPVLAGRGEKACKGAITASPLVLLH
jgi:hypothetical protein